MKSISSSLRTLSSDSKHASGGSQNAVRPGVACYAAVDIGASSGRVVVGWLEASESPADAPGNRIVIEEVHRFLNRQVHKNGHDCWDVEWLFNQVLEGLSACTKRGYMPTSVGIDTWGVDFVLLDERNQMIGDAVSYRDHRTDAAFSQADQLLDPLKHYRATGIQRQPFNTCYQLLALKDEHPEQLASAKSFLMIPDYLAWRLTGVKANEYTNASTTGLLNAESRMWDTQVMGELGIPTDMFLDILEPGSVLGPVMPEVAARIGYAPDVVLPATHDTGSAYVAVPAKDAQAVYLSSGTWSLLGVESAGPITGEAAWLENFTNEGGYDGSIRFLKNIMGLWMIQSIRRELNGVDYVADADEAAADDALNDGGAGEDGSVGESSNGTRSSAAKMRARWGIPDEVLEGADPAAGKLGEVSFGYLSRVASNAAGFPSVVDVNDKRFLAPASMIEEVCAACHDTGQVVPASIAELMQCVYSSLAQCYGRACKELSLLTGAEYTSINIVGGGCQDVYLNGRTSNAAGIPVYAGPIEGTALGNLAVQMITDGALASLADARAVIGRSFPIEVSLP